LLFNYGQTYLAKEDAVPLYGPELPLQPGRIDLLPRLDMPNCIRDSSPDAWGRRVIINQLGEGQRGARDLPELDELAYLMLSGSDHIGNLDFQASPSTYIPRQPQSATLEELQQASERVERGEPLSQDLDQALIRGSSIGGARPKVTIDAQDTKYIAKFSSSTDTYNVVKAEYIAMALASFVGINTARVELTQALGKDVLLIERFDRHKNGLGNWCRKAMVSSLTIFGLPEHEARYASYETLADKIRHLFSQPRDTLHELYRRMVFNILVGNTDDHARNHAAFWNGRQLMLTPAYDICPQGRTGREASQAMGIRSDSRLSQLSNCLAVRQAFQLSEDDAKEIIRRQVNTIKQRFPTVCQHAGVSPVDQRFFWRRQFLNPYCFYGLETAFAEQLTEGL